MNALAFLAGSGFAGRQSALNPAGPQAGRIEDLWWLMFWVCTAVFVLVMLFFIAGMVRGRRARKERGVEAPMSVEPGVERRMMRTIVAAVAATVITLFGLLVASVATGRSISPLRVPEDALTVKVIGHQWWWDFEYQHPEPYRIIRSPNELHIPVGQPVRILTTSADVIHSFWVPNLHGKLDLIPGRTADTWIQADRPGVYRGQCAEFCGHQHAHMGFLVIAEPPERFAAWWERQRQPAPEPATPLQQRGRQVFLSQACPLCHTIQGTDAGSRVGPDLTHLASRRTLAAGTLPNTRGHLGGWIADPQSTKPGNLMPPNPMKSEDLQALLAYLESLR
ncbi:MAG TPA: cytochrome c oxidase subunit II [Thermoanaerobaculia bacterium]|nr:cytochrome c oxidase subunit II [Thermoanaerobaculia bacterium]